jgi:hypothetical protein
MDFMSDDTANHDQEQAERISEALNISNDTHEGMAITIALAIMHVNGCTRPLKAITDNLSNAPTAPALLAFMDNSNIMQVHDIYQRVKNSIEPSFEAYAMWAYSIESGDAWIPPSP